MALDLFNRRAKEDHEKYGDRLPPGQKLTDGWPVLHYGGIPSIDLATWKFSVVGLVDHDASFTWDEFMAMPQTTLRSDIHCVTHWSKFDNDWTGVKFTDLVQRVERPFAMVADQLGLSEGDVLARTQALRNAGVLRHLSPIFDVFRLGYKSALIAAAVDPARVEEAAAVISAHPGVSHNYAREHRFNLWFVMAIPREHDFEGTANQLAADAGATRCIILPAIRLFKIA